MEWGNWGSSHIRFLSMMDVEIEDLQSRVGRDFVQGCLFTAADLPAWHSRKFVDWSFIGRNSNTSSRNAVSSSLEIIIELVHSLCCSFRDGKASNNYVIRIQTDLNPDYSSQIYQVACPSPRPHPGSKNKSRSEDCQWYILAREQRERAQ